MTDARIVATIARVQRCGKSVDRWDASGVWLLARELGVQLRAADNGVLRVSGDRTAALFLASALRRHKAALLAGACTYCHHNLAVERNGKCAACATIGPRTYAYAPDSVAEQSDLEYRASRGLA